MGTIHLSIAIHLSNVNCQFRSYWLLIRCCRAVKFFCLHYHGVVIKDIDYPWVSCTVYYTATSPKEVCYRVEPFDLYLALGHHMLLQSISIYISSLKTENCVKSIRISRAMILKGALTYMTMAWRSFSLFIVSPILLLFGCSSCIFRLSFPNKTQKWLNIVF